jgi:hypothetical protein
MQLKAYKYRIYPTKEQEILLAKTFGCVRFVWNKLVENFNNNDGSTVNEKTLKDQEEFEFLKEVSAATLQQKTPKFYFRSIVEINDGSLIWMEFTIGKFIFSMNFLHYERWFLDNYETMGDT